MGTTTPRGASPWPVAAVGTGRDAGPYTTSVSWFPGEGDISFPPTYRYERGSRDSYMWQKFKPTGVSSRSLPLSCRTSPRNGDGRLGWCQGGCMVMLSPHTSASLFPPQRGAGLEGAHFLGCWVAFLGWGEPDPRGH